MLVVLGVATAAWVFLHPHGSGEDAIRYYYGAGKVLTIGLVVAGTTLLARHRAKASPQEPAADEDR